MENPRYYEPLGSAMAPFLRIKFTDKGRAMSDTTAWTEGETIKLCFKDDYHLGFEFESGNYILWYLNVYPTDSYIELVAYKKGSDVYRSSYKYNELPPLDLIRQG